MENSFRLGDRNELWFQERSEIGTQLQVYNEAPGLAQGQSINLIAEWGVGPWSPKSLVQHVNHYTTHTDY